MGWYPNATKMPGRNAGYRAGRASMVSAVCHYTVGVNSAGIGVNGYFNTLIRRNGEVVVFAEDDAICWHAGNWNGRGPGIEIEYYEPKDGPPPGNIFTDAALASCGRYVRHLHNEYGIPLDFYDGNRISSHNGFITHRSLIQTGDRHHDWWSREDWDAMVAGSPTPVPQRKENGLFAIHLKSHAKYPNGALFVGSGPLGLIQVDLAGYAKALHEGAYEVKVGEHDFNLWMRFEQPLPVQWAIERIVALVKA